MKEKDWNQRIKRHMVHALVFFMLVNCIAIYVPAVEVHAASQSENLVSIAKSQLGIKERSSNSDDIMYNDWYYGRRVNNNGVAAKYAWCAAFVSWCANQAKIPTSIIPKTANTTDMKNRLINAGGVSHLKGSGYSPKCGDIVFFGPNASQHIGIVEYSYQGRVYYIDGNNTETNPHGVHASSCSLSSGWLWGFVTPNYGSGSSGTIGPVPTSFQEDAKYNAVKGFKGYTCITGNAGLFQSNLTTKIGNIYPTDECTVHELYTNGWCKVTCPWNDGSSRVGFTKISNFIQSPTAAIGSYKSSDYINLYSKPNLSAHIYRIYPGDSCLTIGTSGSATQVFMPMSGKGYYELGWAKLSPNSAPPALAPTRNTKYPINFKCRILSDSNSAVNAYTAINGSYVGHVYVNDDCVIQEVYTNGWCRFTCPFYGKTQTVYGKFSDFSAANIEPYSLKAPKYAKTYYKSNQAVEVGWVDVGDNVTVIAKSGNMSQIIYPADVGFRCGWIDSSALIDQYTVKYDANGGTGNPPAAQTANKGTEITLSDTTLKRTGYRFAGWTDAKGYDLYASGSKYSANVSVTLYAVWRKNTYYITYDANGGEKAPDIQAQTYEEAVKAAESLCGRMQPVSVTNGMEEAKTQEGIILERKFLSWNTKQDGTGATVNAGASYTPNADVTLYAQYGKASFTEANFPKAPERTGYTFAGWYDVERDGQKIEAGKELDENLSGIYARWQANAYTVSYNANGGTGAPQDQTKTFGETLTLSEAKPVRDGYIFKGWGLFPKSEKVLYESGGDYNENETVTLYAVWDKTVNDLASVSVNQPPRKTIYEYGEELNTEGMILNLTYTNGKTETVTSNYTVSGYESKKAGAQTLTVTYGGKTASFEVTVKEQPMENIAVVTFGDVADAVPGGEIQVGVKLTKNPGFSFMMLKLKYDTKALELLSAENRMENHLFMMDDVIMWDSANDVTTGSATQEEMGTVTFRVKPDISLEDGSAETAIGIVADSLVCYNENEREVAVRAVEGKVYVDTASYGDVNSDGKINEEDVQAIREYIILGKGSGNFDEKAADVNGDGIIDGRDIIRLNQSLSDHTVKLGYDPSKAIGSNGEPYFANDVKLSLTEVSEVRDRIVTMAVRIDENPGVAALGVYVNYDADSMELIEVKNGAAAPGPLTRNPENTALLEWAADTESTADGTLAELKFWLKNGAAAGEYPVSAAVASCYDGAEKSHYGESDTIYVSVPLEEVLADGMELNQTTLTLAGGDVAELEANVTPFDATDKTVIWESSDAEVAAVSDVGQIRALKKGTARITAEIQGKTAVCAVTVTSDAFGQEDDTGKDPVPDPAQKDNVSAVKTAYHLETETSSVKIAAGKKVKLKVTGSDGSSLSNAQFTWTSGSPKIASVNQKGVVRFRKNSGGKKAVITAVRKDGSGSPLKITLRSMKGAVKSIQISGKKTVKAGKTIHLKAVVKTTKGAANKKVVWTSDKPKIAKVSPSGKVTAAKGAKGKVKITAKATDGSGKKKTVKITVKR